MHTLGNRLHFNRTYVTIKTISTLIVTALAEPVPLSLYPIKRARLCPMKLGRLYPIKQSSLYPDKTVQALPDKAEQPPSAKRWYFAVQNLVGTSQGLSQRSEGTELNFTLSGVYCYHMDT